jgi:hypothetical protein
MRQINNRISDAAGRQLDDLATSYESQRVALEIVIKEAHEKRFPAMNQIEKSARESGKWIVSDACRNPHLNKEYRFDTEREAKSHVRERQWSQCIYGPGGEFLMWDGHKWK